MAERRQFGLRTRITLAATGIVAIALAAGAIVFGMLLQALLTGEAHASAERDAAVLAAQFETSGVPNELDDLAGDGFFQVVDAAGRVIAASEDLESIMLFADETVRIGDEQFVVVSEDFSLTAGGDYENDSGHDEVEDDARVIVGRSLDSVAETMGTVIGLLAIAVPLVVALVGFTTAIVVRGALGPVDRMRRQVDTVTGSSLDHRVDDPGSDDEIGRLARTMNAMLDRLDRSQRAQRQFISDASHELKSPLASLRQYAEVADAHPDRFTSAELAVAMLDEGGRLERLVQGMLVLARADERALSVQPVAGIRHLKGAFRSLQSGFSGSLGSCTHHTKLRLRRLHHAEEDHLDNQCRRRYRARGRRGGHRCRRPVRPR